MCVEQDGGGDGSSKEKKDSKQCHAESNHSWEEASAVRSRRYMRYCKCRKKRMWVVTRTHIRTHPCETTVRGKQSKVYRMHNKVGPFP